MAGDGSKGPANRFGALPSLRKGPLPPFPGWAAALGPGVVWMALAQGSGELIWWPYIVAKYGLGFLFLLIPACLLQFPLNYAIGSYTMLTGETIFQGFVRLNRWVALSLWALMTVSFLWFGAFASAGGTALAALTGFPPGLGERGQTLFWGYLSIALFFTGLVASRLIYVVVERVMWVVAIVTVAGLLVACGHPMVASTVPEFLRGLFVPPADLPRPWDPADATKLLTAVTFAGLGGFWTLFYSYWLREKGCGMASFMERLEGLGGRAEVAFSAGIAPGPEPSNSESIGGWRRFLVADTSVGILGNVATTLMTCLLAYAVLFPQGILPQHYELAVVQARFFEISWGAAGRILFLFVAAAFLCDTWMATADAVARIHTDCVMAFFPRARLWPVRRWYLIFLVALTAVTSVTMWFAAPGPLILLSAVIGFGGTVSFTVILLALNHAFLPSVVPKNLCPGRVAAGGLVLAGLAYGVLAITYLWAAFFQGR